MRITLTCFILLIAKISFAQSGDNFFNSTQIHTIYLTFDQTGWWDSLLASNDGEFYILTDAVIDGVDYDSIGVKTKGNSSLKKRALEWDD